MDTYQITYDNGQILRIENEDSSAITLRYHGDTARILSIYVPEKDRNEEIGKGLLYVAESELYSRGVRLVEADYSDSLTAVTGLLRSAGYHITESAQIIALDIKGLFASEKAKKYLGRDIEGAIFITLEDLGAADWDGMMKYLDSFGIQLSTYDIARFSQRLSGVMCDETGKRRAVLLCTESEDSIHLEFLAGNTKNDTKYVNYAMAEMLREVSRGGGRLKNGVLTLLASDPSVISLLEEILGTEYGPERVGCALYAGKKLKKEMYPEISIEESPEEDRLDDWRREIAGVPFQSNIAYKMVWEPSQEVSEVFTANEKRRER
ncbi:MAG: hypothetical protein IKI75_00660 [Lachnospiraceae bacterium]|nr:hypothetical protein [Lachnospiraceae bacterium]